MICGKNVWRDDEYVKHEIVFVAICIRPPVDHMKSYKNFLLPACSGNTSNLRLEQEPPTNLLALYFEISRYIY